MKRFLIISLLTLSAGCGSINGEVQTPLGTFTFASPNASPTGAINVTY